MTTHKHDSIPQALVHRFLTDAAFRSRALADPAKTLPEEGFHVSTELIARFKSVDPKVVEEAVKEYGGPGGGKGSGTC